jgi:anti-sigma factor RsiW
MMGPGNDACDRSFPELLAAYADGELDAADRARVEAWLEEHPEARGALEGQMRLSRRNRKLWKVISPLAPSEGNWARVFGRVQDVLDSPIRPAPPRPARRRLPYIAAAIATAAALMLAIYLQPPASGPQADVSADNGTDVEVLALADDADVDIVSIDDRDSAALVIGQPPLAGTVVLAAVGDVELKGVQKADDGMMPKVQMTDAGYAPMIIAPLAGR